MSDDFIDENTIISPDTIKPEARPDAENDPLIGQELGNYKVLSLLGRGGFGSIYKAEDTKLGRMVALKFLTQFNDEFHSELFQREAQALGKLSKHPHIVQIHTWDEHEGQNFFVLEYMDTSVADILQQHPDGIPPARATRIIAECAEALDFAHSECILHRDIKSPNILIECPDGKAKIADFGLARICGTSNQNTIEGSVIGSPAYMAPEQARGSEVTPLCDIYSLGATLHEMLSGKPLYKGKSVLAILEKVRNNECDPLAQVKPGLPHELYAIVDKATAHDPEKRYQSAAEMSKDLRALNLEDIPEELTEEAMESTDKQKSPWLYICTGLALLFWVYMGWVFLNYGEEPEPTDPPVNEVVLPKEPTVDEEDQAPPAEEKAQTPPAPAPAPEPAPAEPAKSTPPEPTPKEDPTLKEEAKDILIENKDDIVDWTKEKLRNLNKDNKGKGKGKKK